MPPSSTNVYGGQHDTQYVTFEQLLLHAALFVADEIRGSMLEPNRNTQVTPPPSGLWVRTTTSYCSKQPGQTGQLVHYNFSTPYIPGTWYYTIILLILYYCRMKNQHGHGMCWMSTGRKNGAHTQYKKEGDLGRHSLLRTVVVLSVHAVCCLLQSHQTSVISCELDKALDTQL